MEFSFTGISKMTLEHFPGQPTSTIKKVDIRLEVSKNIDKAMYLQRDLPTKEGIKPLTQAFLQGLTANIKAAHNKGWWNEADHIRYIIDYLQKGYIHDANVFESTM